MVDSIKEPTVGQIFKYLAEQPKQMKGIDTSDAFEREGQAVGGILERNIYVGEAVAMGSLLKNTQRLDNIYTEGFYRYILNGYHHLHATNLYTISNIDVLNALEGIPSDFNVQIFKETNLNDVYYMIQTRNESIIIFSGRINIESLFRTVSTVRPPLNQIYVLTKDAVFPGSEYDRFLLMVCSVLKNYTSLFLISNVMPYELKMMGFFSVWKENDVSVSYDLPITRTQLIALFLGLKSRHILFGQCLNSAMTIDKFEVYLRNRLLPSCFLWRRVVNSIGDKSEDYYIVILMDGGMKQGVYRAKQLTLKHGVKQMLFDRTIVYRQLDYKNTINRLSQHIYIFLDRQIIFFTNAAIFNVDKRADPAIIIGQTMRGFRPNKIKGAFLDVIGETVSSGEVLFEYGNVQLCKLRGREMTIFTFVQKNDERFSLRDFLFTYIKNLDISRVKDHIVLESIFTLYKLV